MDEYEQNQGTSGAGEGYQQPPPQDWEQQAPPPEQPPQQQWQQPQQQKPPSDMLKGLSSNNMIVIGALLGLLIIMVGAILVNATNSIDDSRHVLTMGNILKDVGVFLIASIMLIAAIYRDDWDKWMRIGLAGFALVLIVVCYFPVFMMGGMNAGVDFDWGIDW